MKFDNHFLSDKQQAKIPDIEKCLDVVATLQAKKGTGEVRFYTCLGYFVYLVTFSVT